jgi:hypothetical protein
MIVLTAVLAYSHISCSKDNELGQSQRICVLGEYSCQVNTLRICNDTRTGWVDVQQCTEDERCDALHKVCVESGAGGFSGAGGQGGSSGSGGDDDTGAGNTGTGGACDATDFWSPSAVTDTDDEGTQYLGLPYGSIRVELEASDAGGPELRIRACKDSGTIRTVGAILFEDTTTGTVLFDGSLQPTGGSCTEWGELSGETTFAKDDLLEAAWIFVAPDWAVRQWSWDCEAKTNVPDGACWGDTTPSMTRTCK